MLSSLLDPRLAAASAAEAAISGQASPWPDEPFDTTALDAFEGTVKLDAGRLTLADGIGLDRAAIDIALERGKVDVRRIEGSCLGGSCSVNLRIDKAAAGVDLTGSLSIAGGIAPIAGQTADGTIGGEVAFAGKGTSPRGALSVLQGKGTLALGQARLTALWPGAIGQAADAALKSDPDGLPGVVRQTLASALSGGALQLPESLALEIADGRLSIKPVTLETPEGRATGSGSLDLKTLAFESDWRVEQKASAAPGARPPLPAVTVSYRGPVAALGRLTPRIGSEALERELAVRRMERDVEELERLRKLDEARRREEVERQRRQLEQAPLPLPVPAPVPVAPAARPAAPG
jgi:hypothetical protein